MKIRQLQHSVYQVNYHIVWGTKYRRKFLKEYVRIEIVRCLYELSKKYPRWYFDAINTGDDHVHLLMVLPPNESISSVVQKIKSVTSASLRKKFKYIDQIYGHSGIWGVGYFVSTVGLNEEMIRRYIDLQNDYDRSIDVTDRFS